MGGKAGLGLTILGLGNRLLADDGIGPRVVRELAKDGLPPGVAVREGGGPFYRYFDIFEASRGILAVDALQGGGPPGAMYLLDRGGITGRNRVPGPGHEDDFPRIVAVMDYYGLRPRVHLLGVEPAVITASPELSPLLVARWPVIIRTVRALAARLGGMGAGTAGENNGRVGGYALS